MGIGWTNCRPDWKGKEQDIVGDWEGGEIENICTIHIT